MKVIIAGAGSVGRSIASDLVSRGHEVVMVDRARSAMRIASVPAAEWHLGDACDPHVLEEAGIDEADIVVAATGDDKANLVVSMLAKMIHGVPRVIGRVNNPRNEWLFTKSWGIDVPVSTPRIITSLVEEAVSEGRLVRSNTFQSGASIYHTHLPSHAPAVGTSIGEIMFPPGALLSTIVRDGVPLPAERDQVLEAGDLVYLIVSEEAEQDIDLIGELMGATT